MDDAQTLRAVAARFRIDGTFVDAQRYGAGHINDTFVGSFARGDTVVHYVHQRINEHVFGDVPALMTNIERVTEHIRARGGVALRLVLARGGETFVTDDAGRHWRTYDFVERTRTYDWTDSPARAYEAAHAFGEFSRCLSDLPQPPLRETIAHFHDAAYRFAQLRESARADTQGRALTAAEEIRFAFDREAIANALPRVPPRVAHNDTKINNVLFDDRDRAVCIVDLDTVMPGSVFADFGDLVRTATATAAEDERDLERVDVRVDLFEAVSEGFARGVGGVLLREEREHAFEAGTVTTLEQGVRFLTDYLNGDRYFRVARPTHNLERARTQFALLRSLERRRSELERIARNAFGAT